MFANPELFSQPLPVSFECFGVFNEPTGETLAAYRKSVAYRFHCREPSRTLKPPKSTPPTRRRSMRSRRSSG